MSAKETLLRRAPRWSAAQAERALRAVGSTANGSPSASVAPSTGAIVVLMTAKEKVLAQAPNWTEAQAAAALRAADSQPAAVDSWLDSLPLEDEKISPEEEAAVQEARDELAAGAPTISHEEIRREFGIG
jgi:hypothetical protein